MQKIQLYIEGQRVDMFEDESVVITQTIKNVQDIGKIFTDFTRTFNLPASKTNNKIFKHYYNFHIEDGFDARVRKPANIELNTLPFTDGRVKLEGVDLKDNKPHTYKITFFGSTVTLKDLVGDDTLSGLSSLVSFNKLYDASNVKDALQDDPTTNDIIVPLITHTKRLHYNSHSSDTTVGNLHYKSGHITGVAYTDLKYAIRLHSIIEAIQTKYGVTFSDDFFVNTNAPYYNLFMWLHRKKGEVENLTGVNQSIVNQFVNQSDANTLSSISNNTTLNLLGDHTKYFSKILELDVLTTTSFSISIQNNGIEIYNTGEINSDTTINLTNYDFGYSGTTIYIESASTVVFNSIQWEIGYRPSPSQLYFKNYTILSYGFISTFTFDITQQIPDIKVIDFLSGLFKMFNLTAYVDKITNEIVVKDLDGFYNGGSSYDITKYLDISSSSVNIALPYREVNFQHEDTETFLSAFHRQRYGKTWGKSEYTNGERLDGGIYDIKTPFSQMKYERLVDENGGLNTDVQVGWFVDDNQESYVGKPLLFYPIRQTLTTQIAFLNSSTSQDPIVSYNIPSNSVALLSSTSSYNMNFFAEQNEYSPADSGFTNTLFQAYYREYITSVFNPTNRITKVSAYLPLRILLNYTLADRFVIGANSYKINSIKTNLKNGKSEIELLNDL
jgi:hypothetical protein